MVIKILINYKSKKVNELKNHFWFYGFDWNSLEKKKLPSPFTLIKNEIDQTLCINMVISDQYLIRYKSKQKLILYKSLINQFDYINSNILEQILNNYRNRNRSII